MLCTAAAENTKRHTLSVVLNENVCGYFIVLYTTSFVSTNEQIQAFKCVIFRVCSFALSYTRYRVWCDVSMKKQNNLSSWLFIVDRTFFWWYILERSLSHKNAWIILGRPQFFSSIDVKWREKKFSPIRQLLISLDSPISRMTKFEKFQRVPPWEFF